MNDNLPQVLDGQSTHLAIQRDPSAVLAEATKAAIALKEVISKKAKPVMFNGEQYLEFEDWQTLGKFYSLSAQTRDALPVDINGVQGAKASADVVDLRTGEIIGHAESYCMRDEQNWKSKPWFQLASMAQTRAGSKALRNVLSWVVVLAGYKPTPAEEMEGAIQNVSSSIQTDAPTATTNPVTDINYWLSEMNKGDNAEMESHLRALTTYTKKDGNEGFVKLADLERIREKNEKWFTVIRGKVHDAYKKFSSQK